MDDIAPLYAGWLALVAMQRMAELLWSHRNIHANANHRGRRAAGTTFDWCAMVSIHIALIALPALEFYGLARGQPPAPGMAAYAFWVCLGLFAAAQALRYWTLVSLGSSWNARAVVDPELGVVDRGPYRWIRHPNYLAVLIEFSAVPLAVGAWRSWIVLNALHAPVLFRRIRAEEALLADVPGYASSMGRKPRFVPGLVRRANVSSG